MTEDPIPPDTKDWTWVVAQPCPECGLDTTALDVGSAAATIEATTEAWERVLARDDVRTRPRPDRWSPLEYACHVRDVLRVCTGRLRSMRAEHDPVFANWDQDATAVEDRYGEQDPGTVAGELREAATAAAAQLAAVRPDELGRPGRRGDGAAFTVDTFIRYLLHEQVHHLWDVGEPFRLASDGGRAAR